MPIVQFRVHPGLGCARMGNSEKAYHLASEFPYFLQERFPNLRFKPRPRVNPRTFFFKGTTEDLTASSKTGDLPTYNVFGPSSFEDRFKEAEGKIFPQAARFRVFAYVFDRFDDRHPRTVFEVTADLAEIEWRVNIANKKSKKTTAPALDPHENLTPNATTLKTSDTSLLCKRLRPVAGLPNLAYLFLERDETDKAKVNGRLHVIGNEGGFDGSTGPVQVLWSDDWYDSAGDGPVEAIVRPNAALMAAAGAASVSDLQFLTPGISLPEPGTTAAVFAIPAWVVVGCPDYVPDMGHFVSLWDLSLARAYDAVESRTVTVRTGSHRQILNMAEFETYRKADYFVHIHPHLCLFEDVKFVSGEAFGKPEGGSTPPEGRAHNIHPATPPPPPDSATEEARVSHGGFSINARARVADFKDPTKLKSDASKPVDEWLKRAIFMRLRKPGTLYVNRKFIMRPPERPQDRYPGAFPRKVGRRMDYEGGPDKGKFYRFPPHPRHSGNLLKFHGLSDADKLCGKAKSPPTSGPPGKSLSADEITLLNAMDDMYWPATLADMPLLRELAYTKIQYAHFAAWAGTSNDVRYVEEQIFQDIVSPALVLSFGVAGDADKHFADFMAARPLHAPAMIDMAYLGAMLGGSFLPGIEVGREAGVSRNWCLFHGATPHFPSIRFMPAAAPPPAPVGTTPFPGFHAPGTLTKDLAVPWSDDFRRCDEAWWPTSRPGRTTKNSSTLARHNWQIDETDTIPHLVPVFGPGPISDDAVFVKEYWKALGFIRRDSSDRFIELEQSWH